MLTNHSTSLCLSRIVQLQWAYMSFLSACPFHNGVFAPINSGCLAGPTAHVDVMYLNYGHTSSVRSVPVQTRATSQCATVGHCYAFHAFHKLIPLHAWYPNRFMVMY